jgi:hypothetical protein
MQPVPEREFFLQEFVCYNLAQFDKPDCPTPVAATSRFRTVLRLAIPFCRATVSIPSKPIAGMSLLIATVGRPVTPLKLWHKAFAGLFALGIVNG